MKRKIAILLTMIMLVSVSLPMQIFAEGDNGLAAAIKAIKEKVEIPSNYTEFNYNIFSEGKKKVWNLSWGSKNGMDGSVNARVDSNGVILGYDAYKPYDYNNPRKLPKISKNEAKAKAESFINKINPSLISQLRYNDGAIYPSMDFMYNFSYTRIVKGIPLYENSVNIGINKETGEVVNYNYIWTDDLAFPAADKAISLESAQNYYKQKLGLRLAYNSGYENQKTKIFAAYTPKYPNSFIDALTGEKIEISNYYGPYFGYADGMGAKMMLTNSVKAEEARPAVNLTPDEIKAVEKVSKLISQEEAERKARSLDVLELTSEYKINYANLTKGWYSNEDFVWDLNFSKEQTSNIIEYRSVNARIDAKTGEIISFYTGFPYKEGQQPTVNEAAARATADDFFKKLNPSRYANFQYDSSHKTNYELASGEKLPRSYSFKYIRLERGVPFLGNTVLINFDTVNNKITSFEMVWQELSFPAINDIITIETAYEKLFSKVGLELQYKTDNPDEIRVKMAAGEAVKTPEVKLVYGAKPQKPSIIDAKTGAVLDGNGKIFKESSEIKYSDLSGCYAENQINALAESGIALEGSKFYPNTNILQKDFMRLLAKSMNYYGQTASSEGDKDLEELYRYLANEKVVKAEEKAPDSVLTREDAVKFIIRSLKYDRVADIKGIFICNFKDKSRINPELIGYVAIAQGLGIVNGSSYGYFNPKDKLTRAQAAVMIYNYLRR